MTRAEFMGTLKGRLKRLPQEEYENAVRYYEEYFEEVGPEGEQQACGDLSDPHAVADKILREFAQRNPGYDAGVGAHGTPHYGQSNHQPMGMGVEKPPRRASSSWTPWAILLVATCFIWVPLLIALLAVAFALYITGAALAFAIGLVFVIFLIVGAGLSLFSIYLFFVNPPTALCSLGVGLALFGLGLLLAAPLCSFIGWMMRAMTQGIGNIFRSLKERWDNR